MSIMDLDMMDILKGKPKSSGLHYAAFSSDNVCQRNLHLVGKAPGRCCSQLGAPLLTSRHWGWAGCTPQWKLGKGQGGKDLPRFDFPNRSVQGREGEADFSHGCCAFLKAPSERDGHFGSVRVFPEKFFGREPEQGVWRR